METTSLSSRFAARAVFRTLLILAAALAALSLLVVKIGHGLTYSVLTYESQRTGDWDIYAFDPLHNRSINLTRSPGGDTDASWSPDGEKLAFISWRAGTPNLFMLTITPPRVFQLDDHRMAVGYHPVWSPDSRQIVYEVERSGSIDLYRVDIDAPLSSVIALTNLPTDSRFPAWSPDGTQIAYVSWATGDAEIMVMGADGTNNANLTQNHGWDVSPAWSPDGTEITFFSLRDRTNLELLLMDQAGGNLRRITTSTSAAMHNIAWARTLWSPDGRSVSRLVPTDSGARVEVWSAAGGGLWQSPYESRILKLDLWLPSGLLFTEVYNYSTFRIMEITPNGDPRILIQDGSYPIWWR